MELKHTKAPWKWLVSTGSQRHSRYFYVIEENSRDFIVQKVFGDSYEEARANTILIASAPELLEALIRCLDDLENATTQEEKQETINKAKQAIQKATS